MSHTLRVGAAACAVLALALPVQAQAAVTTGAARVAAATTTTGFSPVAHLGYSAMSVAAATDGTAYVAGVGADGVHVQLATRTAAGATLADVALPSMAPSTNRYAPTTVKVAAYGGRAYLLVSRLDGDACRLFSLTGTTATELTLPVPSSQVAYNDITLDGPTSLWLSGNRNPGPNLPPGTVVYHGDGTTWSMLPFHNALESATGTYALDGHFYQNTQGNTARSSGANEWTGSAWIDLPNTGFFLYDIAAWKKWTFASTTDFMRWGFASVSMDALHTFKGACQHIVTDGTTSVPCVAPAWPVSAAVRLADGRVVLGGSDTSPEPLVSGTSAVPSGFAVVPTPGATPVELTGSTGGRVIDLAAATTGEVVWALTASASGTDLQVWGSPAPSTPPPVTKPGKGNPCPRHHKPKPPKAKRHAYGHDRVAPGRR